jgi:hypothetical protein
MDGNSLVRFQGVSFVTASLGVNDPKVGDRSQYGDEEYLFVCNIGSSTVSVGHACTVSAVTGYSVTVSTLTSTDFIVGVCKHAVIPTGSYGWLVTRGFTSVEMGADNSAAAGNILGIGVDGTFAHASSSTGYTGAVYGKAMEAIASGASGMAFVTCL